MKLSVHQQRQEEDCNGRTLGDRPVGRSVARRIEEWVAAERSSTTSTDVRTGPGRVKKSRVPP
jgi:hypothetical protein